MTKLQFHGVAYDSARHEQPSGNPVQHTYRGQRFEAPLRHDAAPVEPTKLSYRGQVYQRRSAEAAAQVNAKSQQIEKCVLRPEKKDSPPKGTRSKRAR